MKQTKKILITVTDNGYKMTSKGMTTMEILGSLDYIKRTYFVFLATKQTTEFFNKPDKL